ncbi:intradiol ring-cleavage dioxygenase [Brachybacterium sp. AOP43-C2-M15]|uniref:intradiol ring-cleavage dioxygenase n=1 Tax=Brachybacterium sp. AOP43-C2-M15 TaxID=3457661 RepID=UPI0040346C55
MSSTASRPVDRPFPEAREHDPAAAGPVEHARVGDATWEGRTLDRPEEDVEDQGLHFDISTLVSRRGALGVLGAGSVAAVLAACSSGGASGESAGASDGGGSAASDGGGAADASSSQLTEMPGETVGPYPGDGSNGADVLETSGVERSDLTSSIDSDTTAEGVPLTLTMSIIDMAGGDVPLEGAAVYLWHCDAAGRYSLYSEGLENETYLRGVQVADSSGQVTFTTIVPGCYAGRWPHLHFEVFPDAESIVDAGNAILTSQIALPEAECREVYELEGYDGSTANLDQITLESDNVFSDGWDQQLVTFSGSVDGGCSFSIDVPIDTTTEPEAGGMPGGGEGGTPPEGAPEGGGPGGEPPADGEGAPQGGGPGSGAGASDGGGEEE